MTTPTPLAARLAHSAIISPCRLYRYLLTRGDGPYALFVMLNPSTADEMLDDPTIRRCRGFAGDLALRVVNLFALRETNPDNVFAAARTGVDIVGPDNDRHIAEQVAGASIVLCAWGNHGRWAERDKAVKALIRDAGKIPHYLRRTKAGQPEHPLYLPSALRPVPFEAWQ